jgi:hypothetical protein
MIQAPTWEVDYTLSPKYLRAKYSENPISFGAEFGAEFSDRVHAWIDNEQVLRMNIIEDLKLKSMSYERIPHFLGIDIGLKTDGTALAICHTVKRETPNGFKDFIELDCVDVRYASEEGRDFFHPEEMAEWILSYKDKFFIVKGMMDQYYGLAIVPMLHDKGMKQIATVHMSRDLNSKIYQNLMSKMLDASIRIPTGDERIVDGKKTCDIPLVTEMLTLQATSHSKYLISVKAPEIKGMHDDLSDAFARTVYLATEYMTSGGGIVKHNKSTLSGPSVTYKKYLRKMKKSSIYTKRPSSAIRAESQRARQFNNVTVRGGRF